MLGFRIHPIVASVLVLLAQANSLNAQQKVLLGWRVPENSKRVSTQESVMSQVMDANGLQVKTSVDQKLVSSTKAGERAEGRLPITHQVESLKVTMRLPYDVKVEFDSTKEFEKPGTYVDPLLDELNAFSGAEWTTLLDSKLKAVKIEGNDELLATFTPEIQQGLKSRLSDKELLRKHNDLIGSIPATPVAVGETWTRTQYADFDLGQLMKFEKEFRYEGVVKIDGRPVDKITQQVKTVTVELGENPLGLKLIESNLKVDESIGEIYFDRRSGWIYKSSEKTTISGQLDFELQKKITSSKIQLSIANRLIVR
jgi:hypothetical protein